MAGYFAEETITPVAGANTLLCFAIDQSSNRDHTRYYQKLVDTQSLHERPLGSLAVLDTLTPTLLAAMPPTLYQQYRPIPARLPARIPAFALGCQHAAIIGLIFTVVYPYSLLRLVDTVDQRIVAEYPLPHCYRAQFNSTGTRCLAAGIKDYTVFQIDHGLVPLFTLDGGDDTTLAYHPMWCAHRWCLFQRTNRVWFLTVFDEATGSIVDRIRLHGRPDSMSAAQSVPIIACAISHNRVQLINIDTRRSRVVRHPDLSPQSIPLDVRIAPNGHHIMARSRVDEHLWGIGDGDTMTGLITLPRTEEALNVTDVLLSQPGFCVLNDQYLTITRGRVTAYAHPLPPTSC